MPGGTQTIAELLVEIGVDATDAVVAAKKIDELKGKVEKTGDAAKGAEAKYKGFLGTLRQLFDEGSKKAEEFVGKAGKIGGPAGVIAAIGVAATAAAVGVYKFVESQTKALDEADELSKKLGIGVEELQRLQHAAKMSGVEGDSLNLAMKTLNANLLDMKNGGGGAAKEALDALGVSLADLDGKSRTEQIGIIGDALNGVSDAAERSARAAEIFGSRSGPELAGLLAEGSDGIAKLASEAQGVFTEEQAAAAAEFHDQLDLVNGQVGSLAREIAIELLPSVKDAVTGVRDWIRENDAFIRQGIGTVIKDIVGVVKDFVSEAKFWLDIVKSITGALDGLGVAGDIVSAAFKVLTFNIRLIMTPFTTLKGLIDDLIGGLIKLGIVSEETGRNAQTSIREAGDAARKANEPGNKSQKITGKMGRSSFNVTGDAEAEVAAGGQGAKGLQGEAEFKRQVAFNARMAGARAKSKGGGGGKKEEKDTALTPDEVVGVTGREFISRLLSGDVAGLEQQLKGVQLGGASRPTENIRPSVVMTVNNYNFSKDSVRVEQNIASTDPKAAGDAAAAGFAGFITKGDLARAARSLQGKVVE